MSKVYKSRGGSREGTEHAKAEEVRDSRALLRKEARLGWLRCTVTQETGKLELDHIEPCKW